MTDENQSARASKSYVIGAVGAGARVAQGENIFWTEGVTSHDDAQKLTESFAKLIDRIRSTAGPDEDSRSLSEAKAQAIAEGLAQARAKPGQLRQALVDARAWFRTTATWVWDDLRGILKSEAARKILGTVTEAAAKATIEQLMD
jgi:hypothetical protein